ncbi:MAG: hypothetical protein DRG78_18330, partial [Epsilonproteobacteria bacterium]
MGLWHHRVISAHKSYIAETSLFSATFLSQSTSFQHFGKLALFPTDNIPHKQYHQNFCSKENIAVTIEGKIINLNHISNICEYVTHIYKTYGREGLYRLEGEFSLIIYDEQKQLTLLFRSLLADSLIYFVAKNNLLSVSTNPIHLLHRSDVSDSLDSEEMNALFTFTFSSAKGNVFSELTEVKGGEMVVITPENIEHIKRPLSEILVPEHYGSQLEMVERYRSLIQQRVRDSLLPDIEHGIMLSSGMDSSTVAVFAKQQLKKENRALTAYSWKLPNDPKGDESVRIKELCQALDIPLKLFNGESFGPFDSLDNLMLLPDTPYANPYWSINAETYRRASDDGIGALLNGGYGDMLFRTQHDLLIDIIKDRRFDIFLPEIYAIVKELGYSNAIRRLLRNLIPDILLKYRRKTDSLRVVPWLSDSAKESRSSIFQKKEHCISESGFESFALPLSPYQTGHLRVERYLSRGRGITLIDPYIDIKLLNYTLGIPTYMTHRNGQTKYFAREAMRGLLPESIRLQPRVGILTQILQNSYDRNKKTTRERILDDRKVWKQYVDESWMENKLNSVTALNPFNLMVFWLSINIQAWQKAIKPGGSLYEG